MTAPPCCAVRVLVADDDQDCADALARLLGLLIPTALHVRVAFDGHQTLQIIERWIPDVVLLDLEMPFVSGSDAAFALRQLHPSVRLIAVSGDVRAAKAAAEGKLFDDAIVKPIHAEGLIGVVLGNRWNGPSAES